MQIQNDNSSSCSNHKQVRCFACELSLTAQDLLWLTTWSKSWVEGMLWKWGWNAKPLHCMSKSSGACCIIRVLLRLWFFCCLWSLRSRLQIEVTCKVRDHRVWNAQGAYHRRTAVWTWASHVPERQHPSKTCISWYRTGQRLLFAGHRDFQLNRFKKPFGSTALNHKTKTCDETWKERFAKETVLAFLPPLILTVCLSLPKSPIPSC